MSEKSPRNTNSLLINTLIGLFIAVWSIKVYAIQSNNASAHIPLIKESEAENWTVVNDTVMGGRSQARIKTSDTGLIFEGFLSLENNGGFASIRRYKNPVTWEQNKAIKVRVIGDGKRYQFRIRTDRALDGVAYAVNFNTIKDSPVEMSFTENDFTPVWRGRKVRGAPVLNFADARQIGFMLTDKQVGDFRLFISAITQ